MSSHSGSQLSGWLERIEKLHPSEIELGLERLRGVAVRLLDGAPAFPVITVAGTNGKGSVVALIDSLARQTGWRTGRYTSPHLFRFNERIVINAEPVSDQALCQAFEQVEQARADTPLTYFEFTTLAAFWLFAQQTLDLLVLEVGLGGRLDAVNLLDPDVAVITSVGLDHTDWLGDTRELIGAEKAGILRPGRPLIYGEVDMPDSVASLSAEHGCQLYRAGQDFAATEDGVSWQGYSGARELAVPPPWLGADNLVTALQALARLNCEPSDEDIRHVAATLRLAGRCQPLQALGRRWLLDVGHNHEALARFASRVTPVAGRTLAVCGMLADKPAGAIHAFVPLVSHWYLTAPDCPRAGSAQRLAEELPAGSQYSLHSSVAGAIRQAAADAEAEDQILVFGSFFTVIEATQVLEG